MIDIVAFEVSRDDLRKSSIVHAACDPQALAAAGKVVLAIDRFALTANNITYAAYGDEMAYWAFFPGSEGCGRVPVWGFADVVASGASGIAVGERFYGYFPMASHLVVEPVKISSTRFIDGATHRAKLPPVYNQYLRVTADPSYTLQMEAPQMILKPLVMTSFLIADFLEDNAFFGARQIVVSSASSKTSLGLGFCLRRLGASGISTVGLTSSGNKEFVERVGYFDSAVSYDAVAALGASVPTVYVDMAGDATTLSRVHTHFGDQLLYSCRVGATHWEGRAKRMELPGARPKFFFAPAQIQKRAADWGPGGLESRFASAWSELSRSIGQWLAIKETRGEEAVRTAYHDVLEGRGLPSEGLVLSFKRA